MIDDVGNGASDPFSEVQAELLRRYAEGGIDAAQAYVDQELSLEGEMTEAVGDEAERIADEGIMLDGLIPKEEVRNRVITNNAFAKDRRVAAA